MNTTGRLIKLIGPAGKQGVHRSFLGRASHATLGEMDVHLKVLTGKRMANEMVVETLARALAVNVPLCFAIALNDEDGRVLGSDHVYRETRYLLASQLVPHSSSLRDTATLVDPSLSAAFFASPNWRPIVMLDTLVANSDRTADNVLVDESSALWAIDHDTAFGADWESIDLQAARPVSNILARPGQSMPTQDMRLDFLKWADQRNPKLDVEGAISSLPAIGLLTPEDTRWLSLYVIQRWQSLDALLRHALFSQY